MLRYEYDAWGRCKIVKQNGEEAEYNAADPSSWVAFHNHFRYRGYFYDTTNGFYYLQTRFYDPELCRFISPDSLDYVDPATIGGVNLYSYCNNNPVMFIDPDGHTIMGAIFAAILIGGLLGGAFGAISAYYKKESGLQILGAFVGGFITGAALGVAFVLGGGFAVGSITVTAGHIAGTAVYLTVGTFGVGMGAYYADKKISQESLDYNDMAKNGAIVMTQGLFSFGIGMATGAAGCFESLKAGNGFFDVIKSELSHVGKKGIRAISKGIGRGIGKYIKANYWQVIVRMYMKNIFTFSWNLIKP